MQSQNLIENNLILNAIEITLKQKTAKIKTGLLLINEKEND